MPENRVFAKSPKSYRELLEKLKGRNLVIKNQEAAETHLRNIGYYRLIGYGLPFEERDAQGKRVGRYLPETSFDTLITVYITDRKIRTSLLSAIERIEIAVRNIINHELACKYQNAHWYMDESLFKSSNDFTHASFLREIKGHTQKNAEAGSAREGKREVFIHHYYSQYDEPEYPACWMISETLPLGAWSKVYEHLAVSKDRKIISKLFDIPPTTLQSWLHSITYLRNMCAHHSRLFGRKFVMRPSQTKGTPFIADNLLFNFICITYRMLKIISPHSKWIDYFHDELESLDKVTLSQYGFEENWLEEDFWLE